MRWPERYRIEKAFGLSMDTLLRMQAWHYGFAMHKRADEIEVQRFIPEDPTHK